MNRPHQQRRKRNTQPTTPITLTRCGWCRLQIDSRRFKKHSFLCMRRHADSVAPGQASSEENNERESMLVDDTIERMGSSSVGVTDNKSDGGRSENNDETGISDSISGSPIQDDVYETSDVGEPEHAFDPPQSGPRIYQFPDIESIKNPSHRLSVKLQTVVNRFNIPRAGHEELTELFNEAIDLKDPGCGHMLSPYLAKEASKPLFPVKLRQFPVCRNGCMLFAETNESVLCTFCGAAKYTDTTNEPTNLKPYATVHMLPLGEQLAFMLHNPTSRDLLLYRSNRQHQTGQYDDIFDGQIYQEHAGQLFTSKFDITIGLYVDGFQPFKGSKHSMSIIHVIILNIDPSLRYENKNMLQVCITPGPNRPKDLWSFLNPILNDLDILQNEGMIVKTGKDTMHAKVHLLFATGDIPAVTSLANHAGHTSLNGCRICLTVGVHRPEGGGGIFFPTSSRHTHEWHTVQGYREALEDGINEPTRFAFMKFFHGPEFFGLDEMHLLGHGISRQFLALIQGDYTVPGASNPFHVTREALVEVMEDMEHSRNTIPTAFQGSWKSFQNRSKIRAVDRIDFICYVVPTLVIKKLANPEAKRATMALVAICQTCLQYSITEANIDDIERDIVIWHDFLTQLVERRILSVSVFTPSQHYLSHVPGVIRKLVPMRYYSARSMERAIGLYSRLITSRSAPGVQASNIMLRLAMERYMGVAMEAPPEDTSAIIPESSEEPEPRGARKHMSLNSMVAIAGVTRGAFEKTFREFNRRIEGEAILDDDFSYYGSVWSNSKVFGSVLQHSERNRAAYFVLLSINVDKYAKSPRRAPQMERKLYFGKVYFYFQCTIHEATTMLAVVGLYKVQMMSNRIYIHPSTNDQLFVVDCADIEEFVGLVTERRFGMPACHYCIWPGMITSSKYINDATIGDIRYI